MTVFDLTGNTQPSNAENTITEGAIQSSEGDVLKENKTDEGTMLPTPEELMKDKETAMKSKDIRMEGPLAAIYAQALNIEFAREDLAGGTAAPLFNIEAPSDDTVPDLYVYATGTDEIEKEGLAETFEKLRVALDKYKDTKTFVVIETGTNISNKVAALEEYAVKHTRVGYNRQSSISKIANIVKSL